MTYEYKTTDNYILFWGSVFSNWHPCSINYNSKMFKSSEQLFMWFKAMFFDDLETAELIFNSQTSNEAKDLGRQVKGYDDYEWNKVKDHYMYLAVYHKFNQSQVLYNKLKEGLGKHFVEGSPYDTCWGIGVKWDDPKAEAPCNWKGENRLGHILDNVLKDLYFAERSLKA